MSENAPLDDQGAVVEDPALPVSDTGPEAQAASESETQVPGEAQSDELTSDEKPEPKDPAQKQLEKLKRQRYEAKRQAERERKEREYWQQKALEAEQAKAAPATAAGKPVLEKFQTYEEYLEALSDWKVTQHLAQERQHTESEAQQRAKASRAETYHSRVQKAIDSYEDFEEVAHGDHWSPTPQMTEAIQDSEKGPDLAYYLGSHPDEAERIAGLAPSAQYREIGRLEERLERGPARKTTEAPAPIKPAGTRATAQKDPAEMSFHEFTQWRQKFIAQRR